MYFALILLAISSHFDNIKKYISCVGAICRSCNYVTTHCNIYFDYNVSGIIIEYLTMNVKNINIEIENTNCFIVKSKKKVKI